jgi:branched-chain amino acid transport system permease protein
MTQIILNGLLAGLLWGLVAVGFTLIYSTVRFFHAAHGASYLVGAYASMWVLSNAHLPWPIVALAAMLAAGGFGCALELSVYRPLRTAGSSPLVLFLASVGVLVICQNTIALCFGSDIQVLRREFANDSLELFECRITRWQLISAATAVTLFAVTWALVRLTAFGKEIRSVSDDLQLARSVGIRSDRIFLLVNGAGSALAGAAGLLAGYDTALTPTGGFNVLFLGVTSAIVGGIGSIPGAMAGGVLVGIAQHIGIWRLPTEWQDAVVFVILVLFLLFRPEGVFGKPLRRVTV